MKELSIETAANMSEKTFLCSLEKQGTYEDLTDIITYLTAERPMTTQRLGYLLYFAYAWGLVLLHRQIAPFQFIQTYYGPMELIHHRIYPSYDVIPSYEAPILDQELTKLLDLVLHTYGNEPLHNLEARLSSHMLDIAPGFRICSRDIYMFFSRAIEFEPDINNADIVGFTN